jgi:hypothetical protein
MSTGPTGPVEPARDYIARMGARVEGEERP